MAESRHATLVSTLSTLHASGCFIIPNPWDIGSAKILQHIGFKALATTSAGFAFSRGLPDEATALSLNDVLAHIKEIVEATPLPVNADFQSGYADDLETLARNVTLCVQTGVAGLSIEDATGDDTSPLYDRAIAIERIRTARKAIDATGTGVLLTARCEAFLVGDPDAERIALDRLVAFAEAGADCLYAPRVTSAETISRIVKAVAPKPVNVLMVSPVPGLTFARLADLGVRRISVGSALSRVALGAFIRAATDILKSGTFDSLADSAPFKDLNDIFKT
ncbi:MAG: isocitrate lyase/phosphoenolpyruvate mutase family protein [bacterium]|nr:isocitrate lyase/phosphoenolpyruvate mutase family protein [bacterium]